MLMRPLTELPFICTILSLHNFKSRFACMYASVCMCMYVSTRMCVCVCVCGVVVVVVMVRA